MQSLNAETMEMPENDQEQQQDEKEAPVLTRTADVVLGLSRKVKDLFKITEMLMSSQQTFSHNLEILSQRLASLQTSMVESIEGLAEAFDKRTKVIHAIGTRVVVFLAAIIFAAPFCWLFHVKALSEQSFMTLMVFVLTPLFGEASAHIIRGALPGAKNQVKDSKKEDSGDE